MIVQPLKKAEKGKALVAKLGEMKDPDEAYALVASIQDGYTCVNGQRLKHL